MTQKCVFADHVPSENTNFCLKVQKSPNGWFLFLFWVSCIFKKNSKILRKAEIIGKELQAEATYPTNVRSAYRPLQDAEARSSSTGISLCVPTAVPAPVPVGNGRHQTIQPVVQGRGAVLTHQRKGDVSSRHNNDAAAMVWKGSAFEIFQIEFTGGFTRGGVLMGSEVDNNCFPLDVSIKYFWMLK